MKSRTPRKKQVKTEPKWLQRLRQQASSKAMKDKETNEQKKAETWRDRPSLL
jgi:hypothetical protein